MLNSQVLEDGSVVHINKTTISDTDDDGNRFDIEDEDNVLKIKMMTPKSLMSRLRMIIRMKMVPFFRLCLTVEGPALHLCFSNCSLHICMRLSLIEADIKVDGENDFEDNFVENFCFSFFFHKSVIHTVSDGELGE